MVRLRRVLVFGNLLVEKDSLPLRLLPDLRRQFPAIEFIEFDTAEDLEKEAEKGELLIIDAVEGIKHVVLITDVDAIAQGNPYSLHDFDLGMTLKLLKKMGMLKGVRIFGVPMKMGKKEALRELTRLLKMGLGHQKAYK